MSAQPVYIRYQVLKIYKTFIRLSQSWTSSVPSQTGIEKNYIIDETRKLFKANKNLTKPHEINEALREAEARLAMAQHYRNPYPRPVNLPPKSYAKREGRKLGRAIDKLNQASKPIYVRSIDDTKQ